MDPKCPQTYTQVDDLSAEQEKHPENQIIKPEDIKSARIIQIEFKKDVDYLTLLHLKDTLDALFKNPSPDHPGSITPVKIA